MEAELGKSFKKEWWMSGSIIVGTLVIAAAILYILSGDLSGQAGQIVADRAFIAGQNAALSDFAALKSNAANAVPYTNAMQKLLPTHDQLIGFPGWLASQGDVHNVSVSSAFQGTNTPATASAPGSDSFSLSATGAESDLAAFLGDLETKAQGYLLTIDSFELISEGGNYRLSAQGRVFSQ
jgi:hypothetical protein